jgi:beta-mannanase
MKKNGGMWRKRIRHGQAERLALRHTIEDFKLLTPDQRRLIRKRAAWFTDRYRRNLVKINATSYIAARAKHVA